MEIDLAQKAISAALLGNWTEATKLNLKIISQNPKDIDALSRLARCYAEQGQAKKAVSTCQKVLKIDPFNTIALKSVKKWKALRAGEKHNGPTALSPELFLEEPGKTKLVPLVHVGDQKTLAKLDSGDEVKLNPKSHRIPVLTAEGKYVGRLPDDLSARLRKLIEAGGIYKVLIKSIDAKAVTVFIREIKKAESFKDSPSFPSEKIEYVSFTPPELVHKKSPVPAIVEEEEGV
jgi:tetratricopeptide (TPR) repeat protein